jgi:CRISPR-associated endoribonuclease Cas6
VKSILLRVKNTDNSLLPYEHNYTLSIAIYNKLQYYQDSVRKLHTKEIQDIHTISTIIPQNPQYETAGINFQKGFFILRSNYDDIIDHLRLAISLDGTLKVGDLYLEVTGIKDTDEPSFDSGDINFRTLSPVLVRDQEDRKTFRTHTDDVPENLSLSMSWSFSSFTSKSVEKPTLTITSLKRKTVRVSKSGTILGAVVLRGSIQGDPDLLRFSYYKGLGSKTGLGLGCWEVG